MRDDVDERYHGEALSPCEHCPVSEYADEYTDAEAKEACAACPTGARYLAEQRAIAAEDARCEAETAAVFAHCATWRGLS